MHKDGDSKWDSGYRKPSWQFSDSASQSVPEIRTEVSEFLTLGSDTCNDDSSVAFVSQGVAVCSGYLLLQNKSCKNVEA